jgi:hypothetical protein
MTAALIAAALLVLVSISPAKSGPVEFICSRGLRLKIIQNTSMGFIHAQLVIYLRDRGGNPAVPYLTWMNLFDPEVDRSNSSLLSILKKLGNDYEVEYRPDFLVLKINFLPDKMSLFVRFLKGVYNYRPFSEVFTAGSTYSELKKERLVAETFRESVARFWKYFFKRKEWKKQIAFQIAHKHFFAGDNLGNVFITPRRLYNVTLDNVSAFYRDTYRLDNSLLVIKGNIKRPAIVYGTIEQAFASTRKYPPLNPADKKIAINNNRKKIFLFNVRDHEHPIIFWFEAISTFKNRSPIPAFISNSILFSRHTGRLLHQASKMSIGLANLNSEMINYRTVSVICNRVDLRGSDVGRFLVMAEREKKRLYNSPADRREYLDITSQFIGHLKVKGRFIESDVNIEKMKIPYTPALPFTLAALPQQAAGSSDGQVIVIVGNAEKVKKNLSTLKFQVEVIDFNINL